MKTSEMVGLETTGSKLLSSYFKNLSRERGGVDLEQANLFMRNLRHAGLTDDLLQMVIDAGKAAKAEGEVNEPAHAVNWALLKQRWPLAEGEERAFEIMGDNMIPSVFNRGAGKYGYAFDTNKILPPVCYSRKTLEECKDNHILFLGKNVNLKDLKEAGNFSTWCFFLTKDKYERKEQKEILEKFRSAMPYRWYLVKKSALLFSDILPLSGYENPPAVLYVYLSNLLYVYYDLSDNGIIFYKEKVGCCDCSVIVKNCTQEGDCVSYHSVQFFPKSEENLLLVRKPDF